MKLEKNKKKQKQDSQRNREKDPKDREKWTENWWRIKQYKEVGSNLRD